MNNKSQMQRHCFNEQLEIALSMRKETMERKFKLKYREGLLVSFLKKELNEYKFMGFNLVVDESKKIDCKTKSNYSFSFTAQQVCINSTCGNMNLVFEPDAFRPDGDNQTILNYRVFFVLDGKEITQERHTLSWYAKDDDEELDFWFFNASQTRSTTLPSSKLNSLMLKALLIATIPT
ncbi:hypothetical protein [Pantoea ananatis]